MSLDDEQAAPPGQPGAAPGQPGAAPGATEPRQLNDAQTMRALSHPVRIALIEMLMLEGPMTATEVGERIGESPTTCSFHLRQLAKYGLVEEAGGGKGRARPWRMTSDAISIKGHGDPEAEVAADVLSGIWRERVIARYQTWLDTKGAYSREWREAAGETEFVFYLTAEELKELREELWDLLGPRAQERFADPAKRPPGSTPVEMVVLSYPLSLPAETQPADTQPADTQPADTQPADTQPADTQPADTQPADTELTDTGPTDTPRSAS
jgi:DNA-binding transcriptional ArsR family regulator